MEAKHATCPERGSLPGALRGVSGGAEREAGQPRDKMLAAASSFAPLDMLTRTPLASLAKHLSLANKANGALLALTGVLGFFGAIMHPSLGVFSSLLLSVYVGGTGALLLRYEFAPAGTDLLRDFGFMYTYVGRAAFLLLSANLAWTCAPLGVAAAILTNANALVSAYVMWQHPSFTSGVASATAIGGFENEASSDLVYGGSSSTSFDPASDAARARDVAAVQDVY